MEINLNSCLCDISKDLRDDLFKDGLMKLSALVDIAIYLFA